MKLLLCEWEAYMQEDVCATLKKMGIEYYEAGYCFDDIDVDPYFKRNFGKIIDGDVYDGVMTLNYFPVLAELCFEKEVPYIAWVYDSPFNVRNPENTLGLQTNYVFFFDRNEYIKYKCMGFETVYHLELAVNTDRLDAMKLTQEQKNKYACDISFVGSLYGTDFQPFYSRLNEYERGYITALIDTQMKLYGCYLLDESLDSSMIRSLKNRFEDVQMIQCESDEVFAGWVRHIIASETTRRERLSILSLLSNRHEVKLYSTTQDQMLQKVIFCGTANSFEETPKIYHSSRINLNMSLKQITSGIPLRVFDILGAGGFLLTNYQSEIAENFVDGQDLVIYESIEDAVYKAEYYLQHEDERRQIAENGRRAVERFSFDIQLKRILNVVFEGGSV